MRVHLPSTNRLTAVVNLGSGKWPAAALKPLGRITQNNRPMSSVGAFERQRQIPSLFVGNCITRGTRTPRSKQSGAGLREGLHSDAPDATTGPSAGHRISLQREGENGQRLAV